MTPYYNKPNFAGIRAHFEAVAKAAGIPVLLYNIPSRAVVNLSPELLAELAQIENIVGGQAGQRRRARSRSTACGSCAGNDGTFLRALEIGGAGGILVASHLVGREMREIYDAAQAGDIERAREIDAELRPIYEALRQDQPDPGEGGAGAARVCSARAAAADRRGGRGAEGRGEADAGGARACWPGSAA